ncbi:hypothetical protein N657DRAFT_200411 [Parathielavia appendiculata]|uniref:Uncharacterized protein n=1 Tax=Parathielavia appendiculata TaxID=2587402 RepID=A0AAN6Z6V7_9PEZI|nr:hypothetical protein N657DRAFT_200411 [Parathielavia appendiculata]
MVAMIRCPQVPVSVSGVSFFSCSAQEPLVSSHARRLDAKARCKLGPRMAPRRGSEQRLAFLKVHACKLSCNVVKLRLQEHGDCHHLRPLSSPRGVLSRHGPWHRPGTCTQCARQSRPSSPNPGCSFGWVWSDQDQAPINGSQVWGLATRSSRQRNAKEP